MTRAAAPPSIDELRSRNGTLIVARPLALALRVLALLFAMLAVALLGGWAVVEAALPLKLLVGVFAAGALAMIGFSISHLRRMGSLYFAADDTAIYFRVAEGGELQVVPWEACIDIVIAVDHRRTRLIFEFEKRDPNWKTLCHATVFYRDTIIVDVDDIPAAAQVHEKLLALRQSSQSSASLESPDTSRKAA